MTDNNIQRCREEFEEYVKGRADHMVCFDFSLNHMGSYEEETLQNDWEFWSASWARLLELSI